MAKRKKRSSKKVDKPQHQVPDGFWRQVWAIGFVVLALLLIVAAFTVFMVYIGWPALIHAAETEADTRYMKRVVIGISQTDRHCKQWQQRTDAAWTCVQR